MEATGGTLQDIVAIKRVHDERALSCRCEVRREFLGSDFPTSTMVQVVALARPELLLEINAGAIVPASSVKDN